jgi:hypothetical protein
MGKCSYSWGERDEEKNKLVKRCCQKETWKGSDDFCIFHDPSPEKDGDLFKKMIEEQIEAETVEYDFTGYYIPEKWDFFVSEDDFRFPQLFPIVLSQKCLESWWEGFTSSCSVVEDARLVIRDKFVSTKAAETVTWKLRNVYNKVKETVIMRE